MKPVHRKFNDGDVIFREGEKAPSGYIIVSGMVDLYKVSPRGAVPLGSLRKGDLLGETGLSDRTERMETAIAKGPVTLQQVSREDFLKRTADDPEVAVKIIAKLTRRLHGLADRVADLSGTTLSPRETLPAPIGSDALPLDIHDNETERPGLLDRVLGTFRRKDRAWPHRSAHSLPPRPPAFPSAAQRPLVIAVATLPNDEANAQRDRIVACFKDLPGILIKASDKAVEVGGNDGPLAALAQAGTQARNILRKEDADLVLWGLVDPPARILEIRFTGIQSPEDGRPGQPNALTWLCLPMDFGEDWTALPRAVALAAVEPRTELQARAIATSLPTAVEQARVVGLDPPVAYGPMERAAILSCFGNASAALGHHGRDSNWYELAIDAYGAAIGLLPREADLEWGLLHRAIGICLQSMGERAEAKDLLIQAIEAYRGALEAVRAQDMPREWAGIQSRLGMVLYRVDLEEGNLDSLKEALGCLQGALQVFNRATYPWKWAEVMHNLGQVLQVYGDQARSDEILERAVDACQQAMEIRTFEAAPMLWAATENNMGSALFLLAKHSQRREALEESADSFRSALGTYRMHGADRLAIVAEKNLKRVEDMLKRTGGPRPVIDPGWTERPATVGTDDGEGWDAADRAGPPTQATVAGGGRGPRTATSGGGRGE
ncbi:MAG: cyclic nucleotide-binding domain-containing protein [Rhodospirillum sp.]|nr:cyclic nucleotide-binding domain-containing protein [Rhodospirillum sp.]MCF8488941.1 cyclic nucleotide-binding domain-containing protein [Rhodospirillum sp.]MCF8498997.1 cyclic nucleotide-binding domain-containing protein [Rhodospirillum sp.]